jgi:hypothetical protein
MFIHLSKNSFILIAEGATGKSSQGLARAGNTCRIKGLATKHRILQETMEK